MRKIIRFECEVCHTIFDSEEDCQYCEASHHGKLRIKSAHFAPKDSYPYKIVVSDAKNNTTREYFIKE